MLSWIFTTYDDAVKTDLNKGYSNPKKNFEVARFEAKMQTQHCFHKW